MCATPLDPPSDDVAPADRAGSASASYWDDADALLHRAELAMRLAKQNGKDRYERYRPSDPAEAEPA